MHVTIRRFAKPELADHRHRGFRAYYLIRADGEAISLARRTASAAEEFNHQAAEWLRETLPICVSPPELTAGEPVLSF